MISTVYRGSADDKAITPAGGASLIGWIAQGNLQWGYPLDIFAGSLVSAVNKAVVDAKGMQVASYGGIIRTVNRAMAEAVQIIRLSARNLVQVVSKAVLSFPGEDIGWYDPVQNGTDVYIRSAYPQWQEGSEVHLDSGGVFYEAEQTGSDVYIRSVDSMKEVITNA